MRAITLTTFGLLMLLATGCEAPGVGDPCIPEQIPGNGFDPNEVYIEGTSVQCRTRVCMVYKLNGDPSISFDECLANGRTDCDRYATTDEIDARVHCSCRCSTDGDSNTPTCDCGDGFTCVDDLVTLGGAGIRGGYCVRSDVAAADMMGM